jgi:hypothetical protein
MITGRTFSTAGRNGSENQSHERTSFVTLEEKSALAVLADAVDRCRDEDMRTPEVLASLDLLARITSPRWPFEEFKEPLNFAIGDPSHAEGRWQNVHASLNAIRRAVGVV